MILLSIYLQSEIKYVFPVRGHSYCQCDRNFGTYSQKLKRLERIETEAEYVEIIRNARSSSFTMVDKCEDLQDFEKSFKGKMRKPKNFQISKAFVLNFFPDGRVDVYDNYELQNPTSFLFKFTLELEKLSKSPPPRIGLKAAKVANVKNLYNYLSPKGKEFFEEYFFKVKIQSRDAEETEGSDEND